MASQALSHGAIFLQLVTKVYIKRCKIWKYMFPSQFANIFLPYQNSYVVNASINSRIALRCNLQEKFHCVTES